jgi:hypothetical protein
MRRQGRTERRHGRANVGCARRGPSQHRQKLGFERHEIEGGQSTVANHLPAAHEQAFDMLLRGFGEQEMQRRHVRLDEFVGERLPIEQQQVGRRARYNAATFAAAGDGKAAVLERKA